MNLKGVKMEELFYGFFSQSQVSILLVYVRYYNLLGNVSVICIFILVLWPQTAATARI